MMVLQKKIYLFISCSVQKEVKGRKKSFHVCVCVSVWKVQNLKVLVTQ